MYVNICLQIEVQVMNIFLIDVVYAGIQICLRIRWHITDFDYNYVEMYVWYVNLYVHVCLTVVYLFLLPTRGVSTDMYVSNAK
jgi:hypothetical protein